MSGDFAKTGLRVATFALSTSLSLMFTNALLSNPLSRGLMGVVLLAGLLLAVLYGLAKYLKMLWSLSGRASAFVISRRLKPISDPAPQSAEQA